MCRTHDFGLFERGALKECEPKDDWNVKEKAEEREEGLIQVSQCARQNRHSLDTNSCNPHVFHARRNMSRGVENILNQEKPKAVRTVSDTSLVET